MEEESIIEVKNYKSDCADIWNDEKPFDLFLIGGVGVTIVSLIGILGNVLTIVVLTLPRMKSSTNTILLGLSICDLVFVTLTGILHGFRALFEYLIVWREYITTVHPVIYPTLGPILEISQVGSIYFTIAVTLERFIVVSFPLKARTYCTIKNAVATSIIIVGFAVLFTLPAWWENSYEDRYVNGTWVCYQRTIPKFRNLNYVLYYENLAVFFVYRLIPFTLLSILNWKIYIKLREANLSRQTMTKSESNEISIAKMLLCVVFVFLACNSVRIFIRLREAIFEGGERNTSQIYLFIATLLINFNSAINFIIYCLMEKKFRRTCIQLFCPRSMSDMTWSTGGGGSMSMSNPNALTTENTNERNMNRDNDRVS